MGYAARLQKSFFMALLTLLLAGAVGGCNKRAVKKEPVARPVIANQHLANKPGQNTEQNYGSLWEESDGLSAMFMDIKARKIGDILTIKIIESSSATNKASTKTERDSTFTAGLNNFFNAEKRFPSEQPFFNPFSKVAGSLVSEFDGAGTTKRSGALTAYMTARIIDVLPNGNFVIEGNREVRVNEENQIITLTGIVRPRDISSENVIRSTYIADARIAYSGSGIVNEKQKPGWLSRLLSKVWPF